MKVNGVVPEWRYPVSTERDFSRSINSVIDKMIIRMQTNLQPMKFDADEEQIQAAESDLETYADILIAALIASLPSIAYTIYKFNTKQWLRVAKGAGGAKNPAVMLIGILSERSEPWYMPQVNLWQGQAKTSIKKLVMNVVADYTAQLRNQSAINTPKPEVEKILKQRYKVYTSWGTNRAVGIIGTFNSRLMRERLKEAGVTKYIWRGVMDERERESHVRREGKVLDLNSTDIFPAEEYGCRCWAVPYFNKETNK